MQSVTKIIAAIGLMAAASQGVAQVVSPPEIPDARLRELQQKHMAGLKEVAAQISRHQFPFRLYFSRTLGVSEEQQKRSDQRAIRFDRFRDQTVLEITANYYASYSAELMDKEERANKTLRDAGVPMLEAAVSAFSNDDAIQGYAIEISHHVRRKVLGVPDENVENVAFLFPAAAAKQFIAAKTAGEQGAVLLQGHLFVNREPMEGWGLTGPGQTQPELARKAADAPAPTEPAISKMQNKPIAPTAQTAAPVEVGAEVPSDRLRVLQESHQAEIDCMTTQLEKEARFVSYAPPTFIAFHKGAFLQISVTTTLTEKATASQYQIAALAFDEHVAHLIRPVMSALKEQPGFDGIDFSTTVRFAGRTEGAGVAIEFVFPAAGLSNYKNYDLTGQQLIDSGFVLINGERVSLELQTAEAGALAQTF